MMKTYSRQQLALRNGQDMEEIWVAVHGKIYNVSGSRMWRRGRHYDHWAGQELSDELKDAPHLSDVLDKFEIVGMLKD